MKFSNESQEANMADCRIGEHRIAARGCGSYGDGDLFLNCLRELCVKLFDVLFVGRSEPRQHGKALPSIANRKSQIVTASVS